MALREKTHASWGALGVLTGESDKIHRCPKHGKKKGPNEVITLISKWDVKRYQENLERNKNRKPKAQKQRLTNNNSKKSLTIRTISRTHVPREQINRKKK